MRALNIRLTLSSSKGEAVKLRHYPTRERHPYRRAGGKGWRLTATRDLDGAAVGTGSGSLTQ